jgi:hypothetical protein
LRPRFHLPLIPEHLLRTIQRFQEPEMSASECYWTLSVNAIDCFLVSTAAQQALVFSLGNASDRLLGQLISLFLSAAQADLVLPPNNIAFAIFVSAGLPIYENGLLAKQAL